MFLQELQEDLRQVMKLGQQASEYQLAYYPPNGSQYVRHRDAFPDDGSEEHQRRVRVLHVNDDLQVGIFARQVHVSVGTLRCAVHTSQTLEYLDPLDIHAGKLMMTPQELCGLVNLWCGRSGVCQHVARQK